MDGILKTYSMSFAEIRRIVMTRVVRRGRLRADPRRIAVAIPTWNRTDSVLAQIPRLLKDVRVGEIVVRDDASAPGEYERLRKGVEPWAPRVRLTRNETNRGPLANKVAAVADCHLEWALLLDSDNRAGQDYLDAFYALPSWSPQVLYCPQFGRPAFDFSRLAGVPLDRRAAAEMTAGPANDWMCVFLNSGNYVVPVKEYVRRLTPYATRHVPPDVFFANLIWLQQGGVLYTVPGMAYEHVVHDGSWFKATARESKIMVRQMAGALIASNPAELMALLDVFGVVQENVTVASAGKT